MEKAQSSVAELVKALDLGEEVFEIPAFVLLSGPSLKMNRFSSSLYFSGYPRVVTSHEVRKVIDQARSTAPFPLTEWVLQVVPESFWVNDLAGVQDPLGLEAQRLAVTVQIYTTPYAAFRNLSRIFENLEFNLQGYYPKTLTLPDGVLNQTERDEEALVIDFSDEATHLVLTRQGKVVQTRSLNWGRRFLTSRIAETWSLRLRDAERLKERFGSLEEKLDFGEELIPLVEREGQKNHQIKRSEFHGAFRGFGGELFSKIEKEITGLLAQEKMAYVPFVLTGGGVKLDGLAEFLSRRLPAPLRLGTPRHVEASAELLMDPAWCGLVGLVRWLAEKDKFIRWTAPARGNVFERSFNQFKEWLTAYF